MLNYQDKEPKILAIIPARGGSKSIPKKNIKPLLGQPLIYYTIKAALESKAFDKVVVSTDSDEIGSISESFGALFIKRPEQFATDTSPTEDAMIQVLDYLKEKENYEPTLVALLEPTSPLRSVKTILDCIEIYKTTEADSLITLQENYACCGYLNEGQFKFLEENLPRRRQDRKPIYSEEGAIYLTETCVLRNKRKVLGDKLYGYALPQEEALDINNPLDFVIAEAVMRYLQDNNQR
jgi:CMP-N,N'-diacetyllegionaminic acid synthase